MSVSKKLFAAIAIFAAEAYRLRPNEPAIYDFIINGGIKPHSGEEQPPACP